MYPFKAAKLRDRGGSLLGRWYIEYSVYDIARDKLVRQMKYFNLASFKTREARIKRAEQLIKGINTRLNAGRHIDSNEIRRQQGKKLGVKDLSDWIDEYLLLKGVILRSKSVADYKSVLANFKLWANDQPGIASLPELIERRHIIEYLDYSKIYQRIGNRTRNNRLTYLSAFFGFLLEREIIKKNPCKDIAKLPTDIGKNIAFNDKEIQAIKTSIQKNMPYLLRFVEFMFYTLARPNEIRQLRVRHIDMENRLVRIPASISKNKKSEYVQIPEQLYKILTRFKLEEYPQDYFVFTSHSGPGLKATKREYFTKKHRKILQGLGMSHEYTLYSWKHTGVVKAYRAGIDIKSLQVHLRHSSLDMVDRYLKSLGLANNERISKKFPTL